MVEPPQRGAHPDPGAAQTATERGTLGPMRDDGLAASPLRDRAPVWPAALGGAALWLGAGAGLAPARAALGATGGLPVALVRRRRAPDGTLAARRLGSSRRKWSLMQPAQARDMWLRMVASAPLDSSRSTISV